MSPHRIIAVVLAASLLAACGKQEIKPEPVPEVQSVVKPQPPKVAPKRMVVSRSRPPVVILVSEDIPAYQQVAERLKQKLGQRATVVTLGGDDKRRKQLVSLLKNSEYQQFVAIGLGAAQQVKQVAGGEDEVIFCQVFNYKDYDLVGARSKGVSALPGTAEMFAAWRRMAPALKDVGVFTGPGLDEVIAAAATEAAKQGITLHHKVVNSDKEMLFEYKQLAPSLQGLWLLPDNRVLSGRTIKEVMTFSVRNAKQVAVFSDAILRLGGVLSITASEQEIVAKVLQRLDEAYRTSGGVPGADLMLLEDGRVQVNAIAAKRYHLEYSED